MPLGEGPITSYFPRLAKGKGKRSNRHAKRKHKKVAASAAESTGVAASVLARTDHSGPSKKRSRKNTSCSLSSASSGSLPPAHDIFHTKSRKAKKTRSDGIDKTCSVISIDDSDDGMHTKNDARLSCSASDGRYLGPLILNRIKEKGTSNIMQRPQQSEHSALNPFATSSKSRLQLSDGTAKRRPCLHGPSSSSSGQDSMLIQNRSDGEHEAVVSSQAFERQEEHLYIPYSTGEGGLAGVDPDYNDAFIGISEDRFLPSDHAQNADHRDGPELEIIKSSQTQNILFDYVSPRRHRTSKRFCVPNPLPLPSLSMTKDSVEMFVRSSQSQSEVHLSQLSQFGLDRRPECSDHSPSLDTCRSSGYREREGSRSQPPVRTYSDGLFSVPRRDGSFTELFAQDPTMRDSCLNETTAESNRPPVQEDSETETDTDDDMLDPCTMKDNSRQELSNASSIEVSNGFSGPHSSDDNHTSLPEVVEEFRAMFGSDESYPPDFPSSLRQ